MAKVINETLKIRKDQLHQGEYAAFQAYAISFPNNFLCLVDTFDTLKSGVINFAIVSLALIECGYKPVGIRIDSGDLAYLSVQIRKIFTEISDWFSIPLFKELSIVASNDINEEILTSLMQQPHSIDTFGIGTHLVTCQKQPALGCVYKLVDVNGTPVLKLSEERRKTGIPGLKAVYRFYGSDGRALVDYMQCLEEPEPQCNEKILCRHMTEEESRAYVYPFRIEKLLQVVWCNGEVVKALDSIGTIRDRVAREVANLREDHRRLLNATPYKLSVSAKLFNRIKTWWLSSIPIGELV